MKFPTVDRFFFCLSLETGAYVLGGLCIFTSISVVSLASYLLARYIAFYATLNESDQDFFRPVLIGSIIMMFVYTLYFLIVSIASIMLIVGVSKKNHNQLLMFLIIMAAGVLVSSIQVIQLGAVFLVPALLASVCFTYSFICVYSLYKTFKNEVKIRDQTTIELQNYENVVLRRPNGNQ